MTDASRNTRPVYLLVASGRYANFSRSTWRGVCRTAYLNEADAEAEIDAFIERCKVPRDEFLGLEPGSVGASVLCLDLVDDLMDEMPTSVFLLQASGQSAVFGGRFSSMSRTLFTRRETAEAEIPAYIERCVDPSLGLDYAQRTNLEVTATEIVLAPAYGPVPRA